MTAISAQKFEKIVTISSKIEPVIAQMIEESQGDNCPYKDLAEGNLDSIELKNAMTTITRILYQEGLLSIMNLNLDDKDAYETIWYAFGYWGGQTIHKMGKNICRCENKCL